jgi:hypothetical protein
MRDGRLEKIPARARAVGRETLAGDFGVAGGVEQPAPALRHRPALHPRRFVKMSTRSHAA